MSYSLVTPCCNYPSQTPGGQGACLKKDICTDRHVISGAISAIHSMPFGVGHLGAGAITLSCGNKQVAAPEPEIEPHH
jgi:hypothetical protein